MKGKVSTAIDVATVTMKHFFTVAKISNLNLITKKQPGRAVVVHAHF